MAGYNRNDTVNNIADGNIINASDLDGEFDAIDAAFDESTGHDHDGTSGAGKPITKVGPSQDVVIGATAVTPKTDNTVDLGSSTFEFKDLYIDGTANIDSLVADTADINAGTIDGVTIGTNSAVTDLRVDNLRLDGNTISSTDTNGNIVLAPNGTGDVVPGTDDTYDLGSSSAEWKDLYIDGTANIDSLVADTADINGGTIDGVTIGTNSAVTEAQIDNININGNAIITTNTNGNLALTPNGTGEVDISKVDIDSGTIDGVTIGGASAGAGSFTTLSASGVATFSAGTVSAPAITTTGDTNTGIFFPAADTIAFTEGGVEAMRIDSSGNVGIGTSSPAASRRLDATINQNNSAGIRTTNTSTGSSASSNIQCANATNNAEFGILGSGYGGYGVLSANGAYIYTNTGAIQLAADNNFIAFGTGSGATERMRIDSSGNVIVGGTSAVYGAANRGVITINGASSALLGFTTGGTDKGFLFHDGTNMLLSNTANAAMLFQTNNTERMRIDSSGNVGIGQSSPTNIANYKTITINGTTGTLIDMQSNGTTGLRLQCDTTYSGGALFTLTNQPMVFGTNSAERMRITSGGYLKASNTGAYVNSAGAFHEMYSTGQTTEVLIVRSENASYTGDALFVDVNRNTTNNSFYPINYYNRVSQAYRFRVADSGNVTNTNGSYGTISDVKNKENIVDATPKLDKINQLQVRNFNFKGDDLKQIGFVAQEFEQVFPSMVEEHPDRDKDGNDLGTTTKSIKTSVLVPILVKAIQEQQAIINDLQTRITQLENK